MQTEAEKYKILIVEDEGIIAADLEGRLQRAGYQVTATADSAADALCAIRETAPDLVLIDIRIKGGIDGIELAGRVRTEFDVPIIYLTSHDDPETLLRASRTQAFGYIKKPIASGSLEGPIEMAIAKHKYERYLRQQIERLSTNLEVPQDPKPRIRPVITPADVSVPSPIQEEHDHKLEFYMSLVDQQSRMFRQGRAQMAKALDEKIHRAKEDYLGSARTLLAHLTAESGE